MYKLIDHIILNQRNYFRATVLAVIVMLAFTRYPGFDGSFEALGLQGGMYLDQSEKVDSIFNEDKRIVIEVIPQDGDFWIIQDDMAVLKDSLEAAFLSSSFRTWTPLVSTLYNRKGLVKSTREKVLRRFSKIPLFNNMVSKDLSSFLIVFEIQDDKPATVVNKFDEILLNMEFGAQYTFNYSSEFHLEESINRAMFNDVGLILGLLFLSFIAIMMFAYKNVFSIVYMVGQVSISMLLSMFVYRFVGEELNLITIMVLPVVVVLSAANSIHLLTGFFADQSEDGPLETTRRIYQKYFLPSLLTSITTSVAFFSLVLNDTTSVRVLGITAGISILISFLICFASTPFLFRFAPKIKLSNASISGVSDYFIRNRKVYAFILIPMLFVAIALVPQLRFQNEFELFIPKGSQEKAMLDSINTHYFSQMTLDILIEFEDTTGVNDIIAKLQDDISLLPDVINVQGSASKSVIMSKFFMPIDIGKAAGFEQRYSSDSGLTQRIQVGTANSDDIVTLEPRLRTLLDKNKIKNYGLSSIVLVYDAVNKTVGKSLIKSLFASAIFLFFVFLFMTKSLIQSLIGLFANLVPLSFIVIIFVLFKLDLNILTSIIAVVCLGIIVDDTIHAFYRKIVCKKPLDELGFGMLTTTLILTLGFALFAIATVTPVRIFGLTGAAIFVITLLCDFTLLLYLSDLHDKWMGKKERV